MKQNKHGEIIYNQDDVIDLIMRGIDITNTQGITVDSSVDLQTMACMLENVPKFVAYNELAESMTTEEFDHGCQSNWYMPDSYRDLDIAEHVLSLCDTDAELQRCGQELLMFQERRLFDLLRYLKYLIDIMTQNKLIWGVGRGSSTASFVLYKLKVHKINSLYYDLDPAEFLR